MELREGLQGGTTKTWGSLRDFTETDYSRSFLSYIQANEGNH